MNWYEWDSQEDFNVWHDLIKTKLNYPLVGHIQATGELNKDAQLTTSYTDVILIQGKWIAAVEDLEAEGLTPTDLRPVAPSRPDAD